MTPITGWVDDAGHFAFDPGQRDQLSARFRVLAGKVVVLDVQEQSTYRSRAANNYYWGVVVAAAVEATGQDAETIHAFWKDQFLPDETTQVEFFHHLTGMRVRHTVRPASTTKQSGQKFFDYVELCRQWLVEWYNVTTPDPDPAYWRARVRPAAGTSGRPAPVDG